jgi:hypothetical protein
MGIVRRLFATLFDSGHSVENEARLQGMSQVGLLEYFIRLTDDRSLSRSNLARAAVNSGIAAISVLSDLLQSHDEKVQLKAARALTYVGGELAVSALRREYDRAPSTELKSLLCTALASTGAQHDRQFLVQVLSEYDSSSRAGLVESMPFISSALSLGLLRAKEATDVLEARVAEGGLTGEAAAAALRWVRHGSYDVEPAKNWSDKHALAATVLASGIPRIWESDRFRDFDQPGVWERSDGTWRFRDEEASARLPSLGFDVHISPDHARSLVSVAVRFGPGNGVGYDYVLEKGPDRWQPRSIFCTWVS